MSKSIDEHIARKISQRRRILGLTLKELGERVGADYRRLHKYETGETRPTPAFLLGLANALECDVTYFYDGIASNDTSSRAISPLSQNERLLLNVYKAMNASEQQSLLTLISSLSKRSDTIAA